MEIKAENITTTNRPTEYIGTIAIDTITSGISIEQIIEKLVSSYIIDGYHFNGLRIYTSHLYDLSSQKNISCEVLLSKLNPLDKTPHNIIVEREISLYELMTSLTAISIQFTNKVDFESDNIDWGKLENPEK